jgi:alpha/beta superfamily hydrolase
MVPGELITALPAVSVATLRFNFRGMGASSGSFSDGDLERLDVVAAIDALHPLIEGLPLVVCGSSFGADTSLCVADDRISAWCGLAPPLRDEKLELMAAVASSDRPKHLVVAERDNFRPPDSVAAVVDGWSSTSLDVIPGADHFFVGRLHLAIESCVQFVKSISAER